MQDVYCSQVWGGVSDVDLDVRTSGLTTSLFSRASDGGRGGDIYYFSVCSNDMLSRIALVDICGHGVAVSEVSTWLYERMLAHMNDLDGWGLLAELNRQAFARGLESMATAAVVAFYRADDQFYFSSAGHPPLLIRRKDTVEWVPALMPKHDNPSNLPLGVLEEVHYDQSEMPLGVGDRLCLYSDGVVEARSLAGEQFGESRLRAILAGVDRAGTAAHKSAVLEALGRHTGGATNQDDVTLMIIEIGGRPAAD
jgi:sigma-B regulation protein RsbU (phosphoserine phosphatase)